MKRTHLLFGQLCMLFFSAFCSAQSDEWLYYRAGNTGVGGEEHYFLHEDRFGNIWTSGRSIAFVADGSVVRINHEDTVFTCWTDFEGHLPSDIVHHAAIDSLDVLWVATDEGLARFDNEDWVWFNAQNTQLPSSNIRYVAFDSNNILWLTFQEVNMNIGGIARYDGVNWTIFTEENSNLPHHECSQIHIDPNNRVWVMTQFGVSCYDGLSWQNFDSTNSGIAGLQINDMMLDENGIVYIVSQGPQYSVVSVWDGISWSTIDQSNTPELQGYFIYQFYKRGNQMMFCGGGAADAVIMFDGADWNFDPAGDIQFDCLIDHNGEFWVSGMSSVSHLTTSGWKDYMRYSAGLSEDFNENILIDSQDRLWVANGNGGAHVLNCNKWQSYGPYNQGLYPSPQDLSTVGSTICEDRDHNIWFAYNSTSGTVVMIPGGNYYDTENWVVFDGQNSPVSWIEESVADEFGNVFFYSDYGVYMYHLDDQTWTSWNGENSPLLNYTDGFGVDQNGVAYFGGWQQIAYYQNSEWFVIDLTLDEIFMPVINDIAFDGMNNMWVATDNGLWKRDAVTLEWTNWNMLNSEITYDHVSSVAFDSQGILWMSGFAAAGFLTGGIHRMDPANNTWELFDSVNSPLPAEQIDDLDIDSNDRIWINSYPKGITVFKAGGLDFGVCDDRLLEGDPTVGTNNLHIMNSTNANCYPNPFRDVFTLEWPEVTPFVHAIRLVDVLGRVIDEITIDNRLAKIEIPVRSDHYGLLSVQILDQQRNVIPTNIQLLHISSDK